MKKKIENIIKIDYWPSAHAKKAYADGYYIEAIQVEHACIERQLRELLFLTRTKPGPHDNFDLAYDSMLEIPFNTSVKVLFIQKTISQRVRDRLLAFNKTRNNIIHKIFFDSASGDWHGYPKTQYDRAFKDGLNLMNLLEDKVHNYDLNKAEKDNK
ncbi:MAG: hypothetical protein HZB62_06325 [Nitrospirae bacterium]|nr:hypothetical protein [Nitrospirota bacterium]